MTGLPVVGLSVVRLLIFGLPVVWLLVTGLPVVRLSVVKLLMIGLPVVGPPVFRFASYSRNTSSQVYSDQITDGRTTDGRITGSRTTGCRTCMMWDWILLSVIPCCLPSAVLILEMNFRGKSIARNVPLAKCDETGYFYIVPMRILMGFLLRGRGSRGEKRRRRRGGKREQDRLNIICPVLLRKYVIWWTPPS